jgi:hypothetical protein
MGTHHSTGAVIRDKAQLALRLVCEPVFVDDIRQREHLLSASITVDTASEITRLFLDFQAAGVDFHQTLKKEPWGASKFHCSGPGRKSHTVCWSGRLNIRGVA